MVPSKAHVITLYNADRAARLALGHWSKFIDSMAVFVLSGEPAAWRSSLNTVWQPMGYTTLLRIAQALTVPSSSVLWIELQNTTGEIVRYDSRDRQLSDQIAAEAELLALSQTNPRRFTNKSGLFRIKQ